VCLYGFIAFRNCLKIKIKCSEPKKTLLSKSHGSLVPVNEKCSPCLILFDIFLIVLSPSVGTLFKNRENNWKIVIIELHTCRIECFHLSSLVVLEVVCSMLVPLYA
jgi:hypothetical protein